MIQRQITNTLFLSLVCFFGITLGGWNQSFSQEVLSDLTTNLSLRVKNSKNIEKSIDGKFIYQIDSLDLPIVEDFSTNRFKSYNAQSGDVNVSDSVYYQLYNASSTVREPDTVSFMVDTTWHLTYDSLSNPDTLIVDSVPLASTMIAVYDISQYPVTGSVIELWPGYNIVDTIWSGTTDTIFYATPDYVQDSSTVYTVAATDTNSYWITNDVCLNNTFPVDPPTIGVALFDGLDSTGYPYDFSPSFPEGIADYLVSKPIKMGAYTAADSIYFSFYYQPQGVGNEPELQDSLVLEFWAPDSSEWYHVWGVAGTALSSFKEVMIPVTESMYLKDGFQFRFYNYSTLSGSFDHWMIDYVILKDGRSWDDTLQNDLAFTYPVQTLLKDYTAMPWRHYIWDPSGNMDYTGLDTYHRNNFNQSMVVTTGFKIDYPSYTESHGSFIHTGVPNYNEFTTTHFDSLQNIVYDITEYDTCALIDVKFYSNVIGGDTIQSNDTVHFVQNLTNYYAYDDGSPEYAYGLGGQNSAGAKTAYKFTIGQTDTLKSLMIHFAPSHTDASGNVFILKVWNNNGGEPGSVIFENSTSLYTPDYSVGKHGYVEYYFDETVLVNGTFYVGVQQSTTTPLNIGFDVNNDNSDKIFFNVLGVWQNTSLNGSLMIRPVFTSGKDYLQSVGQNEVSKIQLYPNPTSGLVYFENLPKDGFVRLVNMQGQELYTKNISQSDKMSLDLNSYENGVYLVQFILPSGELFGMEKILLSK